MKTEKINKISLYKEIGQYFSADGSFDSDTFSQVFQRHIERLHSLYSSIDEFQEEASLWLESYMRGIVSYLREKDMIQASYDLIRFTVDKCVSLGIDTISIPAGILEDLFSQGSSVEKELQAEKKGRASQDEKRNNIFAAALQVFGDMGFHKATMDTIAARAGIGKGSLYRMFKSKDELLEQLLLEEYRKIVQRFSEIFNTNRDVIEEIQEMIEFWVTYINDNPIVYRLIQNTDLRPDISEKAHFYHFVATHLPMLKERIVSLNREHQVKYVNFESVLFGIFGFIDGVVHKWISYKMNYSLTKEIPVILECVFNGFLAEEYPRQHFCKTVLAQDFSDLGQEG